MIEAGLQRLLAGRTAFVIAHRLSTIRGADLHRRPLPRQRSSSRARHAELMARGGAYTGLYGDWAERVA